MTTNTLYVLRAPGRNRWLCLSEGARLPVYTNAVGRADRFGAQESHDIADCLGLIPVPFDDYTEGLSY